MSGVLNRRRVGDGRLGGDVRKLRLFMVLSFGFLVLTLVVFVLGFCRRVVCNVLHPIVEGVAYDSGNM